jgi:hypothetical protein
LRRKSGKPCLQADGFIRTLDWLNQRNRIASFGDNYLFSLLGPSKVLGKTILEFLNANRAHEMTLQCSYGSYFRSEVKLWQAGEKALRQFIRRLRSARTLTDCQGLVVQICDNRNMVAFNTAGVAKKTPF